MKKTKITLIICILFLTCGLVCGFSYLNPESVKVSWETKYGDLSAAAGLEIYGECGETEKMTWKNNWQKKNIWQVSYKVDGEAIKMTNTPVYTNGTKDDYHFLTLEFCYPYIMFSDDADLNAAAEYCYNKLREAKAQFDGIRAVEIHPSELADYYKVEVRSDLIDWASETIKAEGDQAGFYKDLQNFFRILPDVDEHSIFVREEDLLVNIDENQNLKYSFSNKSWLFADIVPITHEFFDIMSTKDAFFSIVERTN